MNAGGTGCCGCCPPTRRTLPVPGEDTVAGPAARLHRPVRAEGERARTDAGGMGLGVRSGVAGRWRDPGGMIRWRGCPVNFRDRYSTRSAYRAHCPAYGALAIRVPAGTFIQERREMSEPFGGLGAIFELSRTAGGSGSHAGAGTGTRPSRKPTRSVSPISFCWDVSRKTKTSSSVKATSRIFMTCEIVS